MKFEPQLLGKCYVLHSDYYNDILKYKDELELYPERKMTLFKQVQGFKYRQSIITESPYLISCYDMEDVFIFRDKEWENPDFNTYGCSFNIIMHRILLIQNTIPLSIIGGQDEILKLKNKLDKIYL